MIKVVILGTGNVATHLINAFSNAQNVVIEQVYGRRPKSLVNLSKEIATTSDLKQLKEADVYIIAIADDAISKFSAKIEVKDALVVHTSGSVTMNAIDNRFKRGVFYPVQTFTKDKAVDFTSIPICLEAEHNTDLVILDALATSISKETYFIDSEHRKKLHIAAVFVNNFTNHIYYIGHQICKEHKLPFQILKPLIEETATKLSDTKPYDLQTGPAKRKDQKTIAEHLELLPKKYKKIYKTMTESISKTYE